MSFNMAFTFFFSRFLLRYRSRGRSKREMLIFLLGRGVPLDKEVRYQGTIWGHLSYWTFATRNNFRVDGPLL